MSHLKTLPVFEVTQQCYEEEVIKEEEGKDMEDVHVHIAEKVARH